jgi:hypothetical protein
MSSTTFIFPIFAFTPSYIGSSLDIEVLWFDDGLGIATF